jgi:hypothetical protein
MSDCLHCDIHDLLESHLQSEEANLADIAAKVTEVLADLILLAPPDERGTLIADVIANLGEFVLQKGQDRDGRDQSTSPLILLPLERAILADGLSPIGCEPPSAGTRASRARAAVEAVLDVAETTRRWGWWG